MKKPIHYIVLLGILGLMGAGAGLIMFLRHGISARDNPTLPEKMMARQMRHMATPSKAREQKNPVENSPEVLAMGKEHFADHCATCHANDGSGQTQIGRNLYPKAPDMRLSDTQQLSDGELYYIIENGIRLTGMPAWGTGEKIDEHASWTLVYFIRHLPKITPEELDEMKNFNPVSRKELQEEEETRKFLEGNDTHGQQEGKRK